MNSGRIMQIGRPEDVYRYPKNQFVAGFMGTSNLLQCSILQRKGQPVAVLPNGNQLQLGSLHGAANGKVTLSIRPEDIVITPDAGEVRGTVREVTFLGNLARFRLLCCGSELLAQAPSNNHVEIGKEIGLRIRRATIVPS
jgi:ABC-type Fe3+/spermidine/putrescine transport system ATPase subunit